FPCRGVWGRAAPKSAFQPEMLYRIMLLFGISMLLLPGVVLSMIRLAGTVVDWGVKEVGDAFFEGQKQRIRDLSMTMAAGIGEQLRGSPI
ncbi:MAG: hypothetical protein K2O70_06495, partial [Desulfovibrionaceae bacterium]|nr:hypothetical protein [Desulfovibrionaceae bacterium]